MATLIENKKIWMKYEPLAEFEAGLVLLGTEVKALRAHQGSLLGARVVVRGGDAWLVGAHIPAYQVQNAPPGYDPERSRQLLVTKDEASTLAEAESKGGLTVVPVEVYNKGKHLKLRVAVVRGKKKADRREDLKRREGEREAARVLKQR